MLQICQKYEIFDLYCNLEQFGMFMKLFRDDQYVDSIYICELETLKIKIMKVMKKITFLGVLCLMGLTTFAQTKIVYDFSKDAVVTVGSSNPAVSAVISSPNIGTAGVVSFTDASNLSSNVLRAFSGGQRGGTGVIDLSLFPAKSKNYSVSWKQYSGDIAKDYKVGVLLRGSAPSDDESIGYVPGIMQGYAFVVYSNPTSRLPHSEFRIYKSTEEKELKVLANVTVKDLVPVQGVPMWYRASVVGDDLLLEYSTDNTSWKVGAKAYDSDGSFGVGKTQFFWGLAAKNYDFFVDDITFTELKK